MHMGGGRNHTSRSVRLQRGHFGADPLGGAVEGKDGAGPAPIRSNLAHVPEGDLAVLGAGVARAGRAGSDWIERVEWRVRDWPTAGASLMVLAILVGVAMVA